MKTPSLLFVFCFSSIAGFSQTQYDTIVTNTGRLPATIKEVTPEFIKFTEPGSDVLNSVYRKSFVRIKYASGKIEELTPPLNTVSSPEDWAKVTVTDEPQSTAGLKQLGVVHGVLSNNERKKLQIKAAMLGGNAMYVSTMRGSRSYTIGNFYPIGRSRVGFYSGTTYSYTFFSGSVFTNTLPDYDKFVKSLDGHSVFNYEARQVAGPQTTSMRVQRDSLGQKTVVLANPKNDNGFIVVTAVFAHEKEREFRVIYFDDKHVVLMAQRKRKILNFYLTPFIGSSLAKN